MKRNKEYKTGTYYYCIGKKLMEVSIENKGSEVILTEAGQTDVLPPDSIDIDTMYETKEEALNAHIEEAKSEIGITISGIKDDIKELSRHIRLLSIAYYRKTVLIFKSMRL